MGLGRIYKGLGKEIEKLSLDKRRINEWCRKWWRMENEGE